MRSHPLVPDAGVENRGGEYILVKVRDILLARFGKGLLPPNTTRNHYN
jgi:hypothetical protein